MKTCIAVALILLAAGCSQGLVSQGKKLADQGAYDRAVATFYEQIKADPKDADAWRELGVAFYEQGDVIKAEDALKQAADIRPDARTHLYLGLIYEKAEDYDKAVDGYRTSLSLNPNRKTQQMLEVHLDRLVAKKLEREVSLALSNEAAIQADTIPDNTIAVVDFDNSHLPPDLAPISKGLAEFTALDLAKIKSLRVVDRAKIDLILKELKLSSTQYANPSTAPRMGRLLGGNHIVTGSVLGIGDKTIRLDGAVVSTRDSSSKMTETNEGDIERIFAVQKDFVFKIIDNLGITLTPEERNAIQEVPTESYLAFMAYCRGLDYESRGMVDQARQEYRQAMTQDRSFKQAAAQDQVLARAPAVAAEQSMTPQQFETSLLSTAEGGLLTDGLDQFQNSALNDQQFIRDPESLDRYGNTPDAPDRTGEISNVGTVIVRGNLDAQP